VSGIQTILPNAEESAVANILKGQPVPLRSLSLDERWLQDHIAGDTSILALGELEIVSKEHRQPVGGRMDFLMRNAQEDTYYAVEVMLGKLDESHIIRTIEYWDIERQRRPKATHHAVIVAEEITSRFFNVVRLLNRAVPLIAIQISAFKLEDGSVVLLPVKVLDVFEEMDLDSTTDNSEQASRPFWEKNTDPAVLKTIDRIASSLQTPDGPALRTAYNKNHIALGTSGNNFCWFSGRKTPGLFYMEFRVDENRDEVLARLQGNGASGAVARSGSRIGISVLVKDFDAYSEAVIEALRTAEMQSRDG
jgi:hypothetical protein